jgi:GntR family transcriptional regulator
MSEQSVEKHAYLAVEKFLREAIDNKMYPPGSLLPTEKSLCEMFGVSRMTIRQALNDLVMEKKIFRIRGKGSFVSNLMIERPPIIQGFSDEIEKMGMQPSSQLIEFASVHPEKAIQDALKLDGNDLIYSINRLRLADQSPMAIEFSYLPVKLFPNLERFSLTEQSLYDIIKTHYHVQFGLLAQQVQAVRLSKANATLLLGTSSGFALSVRRTLYSIGNLPIEYSETLYHPNKYSVRISITQK